MRAVFDANVIAAGVCWDGEAYLCLVKMARRQVFAYGTEASLFQNMAGIPSVVVGPGDIDQAHKPDEWILVSDLEKCNGFIRRLIDECKN